MARITVEDCIDKFESRFELVLVASNRARKLHSGEVPTVEKDNDKNTVIALREIADETISIDQMKDSLVEEYQTVSPQSEEDLSLEFSDSEENEEQDLKNNEQDLKEQDSVNHENTNTESVDEKVLEDDKVNSENDEIINESNDNINNNLEEDNN